MPSYTVIGVVVITIICLLLGYEFVSFDKQAFEGEDVEFPQPRVIFVEYKVHILNYIIYGPYNMVYSILLGSIT